MNVKRIVLSVTAVLSVVGGVTAVRQAGPGAATATQAEMPPSPLAGAHVLVFSRTRGFRHASIPAAIDAFREMSAEHGFTMVATEDSAAFSDAGLAAYDAVVFLLTTGDVLDDAQQAAMEGYIRGGGGYVGVHSATDTEWRGDWTWYRKLAGGVFKSHPQVQNARLTVRVRDHPATAALPEVFWHVDEWYDFVDLNEERIDLLTVDESTYTGGKHGDYHPMAWYHDFEGGRSFYTGLGHTVESWSSPLLRAHLAGGLAYAAGREAHGPGG